MQDSRSPRHDQPVSAQLAAVSTALFRVGLSDVAAPTSPCEALPNVLVAGSWAMRTAEGA